MEVPTAERRRQQVVLYGESVDVLAQKAQSLLGLGIPDLADLLGLSVPMLRRLLDGERARTGNPVAVARLTLLREFTDQLITGQASPEDIPLTIAQIRASSTPAGPSAASASPAGPVDPGSRFRAVTWR